MKIAKGIKRVAKPFVDIPAWVGYDQLKDNAKKIGKNIRDLFVPQKAERTETFEEALARLKLTEADLMARQKEFKRLVIIFSLMGLIILGYTFYLFMEGSFRGGIASFALSCLVFSYTFRYHFWLFQIRQRKLGCTLREWLDSGFIGGKK